MVCGLVAALRQDSVMLGICLECDVYAVLLCLGIAAWSPSEGGSFPQ